MLSDLKRLLGEETPTDNRKRIIILRLKTKLVHRGKPVYVLTCRGHKKVTTNPAFITEGRGWAELGQIFKVFRIVDAEDNGIMTKWLKCELREKRIQLRF